MIRMCRKCKDRKEIPENRRYCNECCFNMWHRHCQICYELFFHPWSYKNSNHMCNECKSKLSVPIDKNYPFNKLYIIRCKDCSKFYYGKVRQRCPECKGNIILPKENKPKKYTCKECGNVTESMKVNPKCSECGYVPLYKVACKSCGEIGQDIGPTGYLCDKCEHRDKEAKLHKNSLRYREYLADESKSLVRVDSRDVFIWGIEKSGRYPKKCKECMRDFTSSHPSLVFFCGSCSTVFECINCKEKFCVLKGTEKDNFHKRTECGSKSCHVAIQHKSGSLDEHKSRLVITQNYPDKDIKAISVSDYRDIMEQILFEEIVPVVIKDKMDYNFKGIWGVRDKNTKEVIDVHYTTNIMKEYPIVEYNIATRYNRKSKYLRSIEYEFIYFCSFNDPVEGMFIEFLISRVFSAKYWSFAPAQKKMFKDILNMISNKKMSVRDVFKLTKYDLSKVS